MSRFEPPVQRPADTPRGPLPPDVVIRLATPRDAAEIAALSHSRDGGDLAAHVTGVERDLAAIADGAERGLWVGASAGTIVAFARARRFVREPEAPDVIAPSGWYLTGIVVAPAQRRRGIGEALTIARLAHLDARTDVVRYFTNARNAASIALHERLGFVETTRRFEFPGVTFEDGEGVLFTRTRPG